jgi:prevent-host-death family protein
MKTVTARDLQKKVKECVDAAQNDRVVVTRRGQPAAVLVGVEGSDWEDVVLQSSPNFKGSLGVLGVKSLLLTFTPVFT